MLRLLLFIIALLIIVILSPLFFLISFTLNRIERKKGDHFMLHLLQRILRFATVAAGVKTDIKGQDNIPSDRPVYFIINHRSVFDIIILYPLMKNLTGFIAKSALEKIPVFSTWLKKCYGLFMNREDIRQGALTIRKCTDYLNSGISMCVFPEGTRNRDREHLNTLLPFHNGAFKPAVRAGVDIVPVVIYNTSSIWEDHLPLIRGTHVKIRFGEPIDVKNMPREEQRFIGDHVKEIMQEMLDKCEE